MVEYEGEFPLPNNKLALFDIDETLIDASYELTDKRIYSSIQEAQESGWILGLSSDTPYEAMDIWRSRLALNGPIVAEKGSLIECGAEGIMYDTEQAKLFLESRDKLEDYFLNQKAVVKKCNPVEVIRAQERIGQPGETVVLINELRRNSLSFFIRVVDEAGGLAIDTSLTEGAVAEAREFYPPINNLDEDINHEYGLLIVCPEGINKRIGTLRLLGALQLSGLAMVGNSMSDYVGADLAIHYAVANSTPEYKAVANYTSSQSLTSGVVEILDSFTAADI